ncbi:SNF1-interacting protein [Podila epigama]|nr:SNF1-interacting protein [Podila epigama]
MGNATTKDSKTDQVDGGGLVPTGIYSAPQDFDFRIVQRLILQRKLAPFYKGLEECDDSEDAQEEKKKLKLAALSPDSRRSSSNSSSSTTAPSPPPPTSPSSSSGKRVAPTPTTSAQRDQQQTYRLYHGAIECPICFLYYPRSINRTRCCDKPMCTECFVQLKRLESAPTESPACPYCVEPNLGVLYSPALLPTLGPGQHLTPAGTPMSVSSSSNSLERGQAADSQPSSSAGRRRSTSHKNSEVVAADDLRPDWNRRILVAAQRQAGSRRASTSSSMSGGTFSLGRRLAGARHGSGSRRSNSSAAAAEYNGYLSAMRHMGTDLEELMIIEAMRQSIQDEHERQAREAAAAAAAAASESVSVPAPESVSVPAPESVSVPASGSVSVPASGSDTTVTTTGAAEEATVPPSSLPGTPTVTLSTEAIPYSV